MKSWILIVIAVWVFIEAFLQYNRYVRRFPPEHYAVKRYWHLLFLNIITLPLSIITIEILPKEYFLNLTGLLVFALFLFFTVFLAVSFQGTHSIFISTSKGITKEHLKHPEYYHHIRGFWSEMHKATPFFVIFLIIIVSLIFFISFKDSNSD